MDKKRLKIDEKDYRILCELEDKELGALFRQVGNYLFYSKLVQSKTRVLNAYFTMFKDRIDSYKVHSESGFLGGKKSGQMRQQERKNLNILLGIFNVSSLDDMVRLLTLDCPVLINKEVLKSK